jgi:hypothetical protein
MTLAPKSGCSPPAPGWAWRDEKFLEFSFDRLTMDMAQID